MDRNHLDGDMSLKGLPTAPLGTCLLAAIFTPFPTLHTCTWLSFQPSVVTPKHTS